MHDVVIAGAGPVGLFLAGELALSGCSVVVFERDSNPASPLKELPLGLRGLNPGSAETLYRRGLLAAVADASGVDASDLGADPEAVEAPAPRELSHFAGISLDAADIDTDLLPARLPGPAMEGFRTSLGAVESVLANRASALGVEIVRDAPVTAVAATETDVVVTAAGRRHRTRWLVGCDGGRSTVRALGGFDFVGSEPLFTGYIAKVALAEPEQLPGGFHATANGMYLRPPLEGYLGMMDFDGGAFDRSTPLTRGHLQTVLRRISGTDVTLDEVHLSSSFTDRAMQVTTYRKGRVLLAGDAAHIHAPLGGQGLNLGIGDAMNLGWKLAATVRARAPEGLLDSYSIERHPIGAAVLDWSRAQVAILKPGANRSALRALVGDLMNTPDGTTHVYRRTSGLFDRYDLGTEHPLVGRSAPDFRFGDGSHLGDLLHDGQGVVLDFTPARDLQSAADQWAGQIRYAAGEVRDDLGLAVVLVRPDGVVAWASGAADPDGFTKAAARWFAIPEQVAPSLSTDREHRSAHPTTEGQRL